MKRRHKIALVVSILGFFVLCGFALRGYIQSSDDYVHNTMPALMETWDRQALRRELNADHFSDADVDRISTMGVKILGKLQRTFIHRGTFSSTRVGGKTYVRMCYSVPCRFDKGGDRSTIFYIAQIDGRWQLVDFDVSRGDGNNLFKPVPAAAFKAATTRPHKAK